MDVKCYHVYLRDEDRYDGSHDLCDTCKGSFTIGQENASLHFTCDTKRQCEVCSKGVSDGQ